eukprot:COSAG01_NODE_15881_length_1289_cov_0.955462_2_plen_244_part_00
MIVAACRSVYEYLQPRGSLPGCVHDRRAPVSVSVCPRARCAPRTRPSCVTSSHRRGAASGPRRAPILIDRARLRLRGAWWWSCCTCASSGGWRRTSGRRGGWRSWPGRPACVEWRPYPGRGGGGTGHAEMEVVARRRQAAEPGAGAVVPARRQARTTSRRTFQDTSHVHGMGDRSPPTGACFMCSAHSERGVSQAAKELLVAIGLLGWSSTTAHQSSNSCAAGEIVWIPQGLPERKADRFVPR